MSQLVSPTAIIVGTVVALVCLGLLVWYSARSRPAGQFDGYPGLARINRWTLWLPFAGLTLALAVLLPLLIWPIRWISWQLLPSVLGSGVLVGLIVAELVCFKAARTPGTASLERRGLTRYLPWPLMAVIALTVAAATSFLAWAGHFATTGQPLITYTITSATTEPTPGLNYGVASATTMISTMWPQMINLVVALLIAVALAVVAVTVGARRPRNGADATLVRLDDGVRRRGLRVALITLFGVFATSLAIAAVDVLSVAASQMTTSMVYDLSGSGGSYYTMSYYSSPTPHPSWWWLQDNGYNALVAVAVACLLAALLAGALIRTPGEDAVEPPAGEDEVAS